MILVIDVNSSKNKFGRDEFVRPINNIVKGEIKHYSEVNLEEAKKYDLIIICGTALRDNVYLDSIEKFEWIKEYHGIIVGICAGMQILGMIFGCSLKECKEIGMTKINKTKENKFFSTGFEAYELHNYALDINDEFEIFGKSNKCAQVIKHKTREFYGFLFHFEVRNKHFIDGFLEKKKG